MDSLDILINTIFVMKNRFEYVIVMVVDKSDICARLRVFIR